MNSKLFQRGVTLVEAAVTTSLVAVAATLGVPSFTQMREARALEGVAAELAADLQYVRMEAVARNQGVSLAVGTVAGGGACYVIYEGKADECSCAGSGHTVCAGAGREIKSVTLPAGLSLATGRAPIRWHPLHGTVTPTGTLQLADARGREIHHIINIMGRVRTCSPGGKVRGHAAC
jgi:type IV fimbrial biogenesis protein FimT